MMATTSTVPATAAPETATKGAGTQKRLLRSFSKLFSGSGRKDRSKTISRSSTNTGVVASSSASLSDNGNGRNHHDAVPLRSVYHNNAVTEALAPTSGTAEQRSINSGGRTLSTSSSSMRDDEDMRSLSDDEDGEEFVSAGAYSGRQRPRRNTDDGASAISGADTDASISPSSLAPSSIVSATNSNSNGSFAPTTRTYKSYASTKPTTLFSVESGGAAGGANRIAVVPGTGITSASSGGIATNTAANNLFIPGAVPVSSSSGDGPAITFSALPSTPPGSSASFIMPRSPSYGSSELHGLSSGPEHIAGAMNAPRNTLVHPRNNPHPASPPPDNASMLTLASSSFAPSLSHQSTSRSYSRSLKGFSGIRQSNLSIGGGNDADEDASVRALAPSRRASDESLGSRSTWSAAVLSNPVLGGKSASINTVDTGGRGLNLEEEMERDPSKSDPPGSETEAQKVARQEGGKEVLLEKAVQKEDETRFDTRPSTSTTIPADSTSAINAPSSSSRPPSLLSTTNELESMARGPDEVPFPSSSTPRPHAHLTLDVDHTMNT